MKVSIYNEKMVEKEPEFLLRLVQGEQNVLLVIVDSDGIEETAGILLEITKDMRLRRDKFINETFSLPLNEYGQLELEESDF